MRREALYLRDIVEAANAIAEFIHGANAEDFPWADIIGFRNIVVHAYFAIDWGTVWVTATEDVPYLRQAIAIIAQQEFGSEFS